MSAETKKSDKTTVKVSRDLHTKLRVKAAQEGKRVEEVVDEIIKMGFEVSEK